MNTRVLIVSASCCLLANYAPAGPVQAGTSGACSNVLVDVGGKPIGFTCENVGSSALLVWNASQITANVRVSKGTPVVSFFPGDFSIDGTFSSTGPLAFIGGAIAVNGSITGSRVLLAGAATTPAELKGTLLVGPLGRVTSSTTSNVTVGSTGKVTATSRSVVVAGNLFSNDGTVKATNKKEGKVLVTTGSKLDIGWDDTVWLEGYHSLSSVHDHKIVNNGTINAATITLTAHRDSNLVSIINNGTLSSSGTVTFVTGFSGLLLPDGTYRKDTFGIKNRSGTIAAAEVVITDYYQAATPEERRHPYDIKTSKDERDALKLAINGGSVFGPTTDNTPTGTTTPVIDSTRNTGAFTPTSSLIIPNLGASISQMNATQQPKVKTLAVTSTTEQLRGEGKPTASAITKPRPKAKPVLVRGAFFGTKISGTITSAH